jgi:transposase-like protein
LVNSYVLLLLYKINLIFQNKAKQLKQMTSITHSALAFIYGINRKTLYNWLKKANIDIRKGCQICWKDQQKIHDMFGDPEEYRLQQKEKTERKESEKKEKHR